jgi:hypothetical protein
MRPCTNCVREKPAYFIVTELGAPDAPGQTTYEFCSGECLQEWLFARRDAKPKLSKSNQTVEPR